MDNFISHIGHRVMRFLAPPLPFHDLLDHPDICRMTAHQLDDLPIPRLQGDGQEISPDPYALAELPLCGGIRQNTQACG